jgi:NAD-specific glutamate dehydrogenase
MRCKVVGEGGNLARILNWTYRGVAQHGVLLNTDSSSITPPAWTPSDHEVNIKILLNARCRRRS